MIRVGVFGSTGYTGLELLRLLQSHPEVELVFAVSRSAAGTRLSDQFPQAPALELCTPEGAIVEAADVVFLCLPHGQSAPWAVRTLETGARVVDLSADFRLRPVEQYESWYETEHPAPELLPEAVYGLTEAVRTQLASARLVANPGCYPTSALLALYPLRAEPLTSIIIDAKSGVSGAGRRPKLTTHFVEAAENLSPYSLGRTHRHVPEMEQVLQEWRGQATELTFSPHLLPVRRGLLSTIYVTLPDEPDLANLQSKFERTYADEPFVKVLPLGSPATLRHAVHTNMAVLGLAGAGRTLIITSAIDNLLKGAAGQALQNMNAMHGLPETLGLTSGDGVLV